MNAPPVAAPLPAPPSPSPSLRSAGPLHVFAVSDAVGLLQLERPWRELFARADDATPFQSFDWQATWWRHLGTGRLWLLTAWRGDTLAALMPLTLVRQHKTPLVQLRFAGAPHSDVQEILSLPDEREAAARAFLSYLLGQSSRWDSCDFGDQREGTPLVTLTPPAGLEVERVQHRVCPYLPLPPTWDELAERLGTRMRGNVRRRRRNLVKSFAVGYRTVDDPERLRPAMAALFALHARRWRRRGLRGLLAGERVQEFHLEVASRFLSLGWLRLHLLELDGVPSAALYAFQLRQRVYHYVGGFVPELARFGLGIALQAYAIEQAIANGAREIDMLRGDGSYKYHWRCHTRTTQRLILGTPSLRSRTARALHRVERALEDARLALERRLWDRDRPPRRR